MIYAIVYSRSGPVVMKRSTDEGRTWAPIHSSDWEQLGFDGSEKWLIGSGRSCGGKFTEAFVSLTELSTKRSLCLNVPGGRIVPSMGPPPRK